MAEITTRATITTQEVRDFLARIQGQIITLEKIRREFNILPGSKSFDLIRNIMFQLAEQGVVIATARGEYKVVFQVVPVKIFEGNKEPKSPFTLYFPLDYDKGNELQELAESIVIREHDLITIAGVKNSGKTALVMGFLGANIDYHPVLMGNEYTEQINAPDGKGTQEEINDRFFNRLKAMQEWVQWTDENGKDKITLLPVREDYAEHIVRDRINIIDWINLEGGSLYDISKLEERIVSKLGRGIGIVVCQKSKNSDSPRGGQFAQDYTQCELLLDPLGKYETRLTVGYVKEATKHISGRMFAYGIRDGVKMVNFREIEKCKECRTTGYRAGKLCEGCVGTGYRDKVIIDDQPY